MLHIPLTGGTELNIKFSMFKNYDFFLIHVSSTSFKLENGTVATNFIGKVVLEADNMLIKVKTVDRERGEASGEDDRETERERETGIEEEMGNEKICFLVFKNTLQF